MQLAVSTSIAILEARLTIQTQFPFSSQDYNIFSIFAIDLAFISILNLLLDRLGVV